jgi:hypothetical protein
VECVQVRSAPAGGGSSIRILYLDPEVADSHHWTTRTDLRGERIVTLGRQNAQKRSLGTWVYGIIDCMAAY